MDNKLGSSTKKSSNLIIGILLASFTGAAWGLSGLLGEVVLAEYTTTPEWLVSNRLFWAGILILLYAWLIRKQDMFAIFKDKMNFLRLTFLGVFGYAALQYLFFVTVDFAGASLATILQFTAPAFVYLWMLFRGQKKLKISELTTVILVFIGVILLVTGGDITNVTITPMGILTGLGSGIALAITSVQPVKMNQEFDSSVVAGWAMMFGGLLFQFYHPFWAVGDTLDAKIVTYTALVVIIGTAIAFIAYGASSDYVNPSIASIMTVFEPLVATLGSVLFFGQVFTWIETVAIIIILASVLMLTYLNGKSPAEREEA